MAKTKQHKAPQGQTDLLDLGLSEILQAGQLEQKLSSDEVLASLQGEGHHEPQDTQAERTKGAGNPIQSELLGLAGRAQWSLLAMRCDEILAQPSQSEQSQLHYYARLYWIEAQLGLRQVPIEILSAPLDSVTSQVESNTLAQSDASLRSLCARMLITVGRALEELAPGDELALSFYSRAQLLSPTSSALMQRKIGGAVLSERRAANLASDSAIVLNKALSDKNPQDRQGRNPLLFVALLVIAGGSIFLFSSGAWESLFPPQVGRLSLEQPIAQPQIALNAPERSLGLSQLDAIFYDVNRPRPQRSDTQQSASPPVAEPASKKPREPAQVDTSGPLESDAIRDAMTGAASDASSQPEGAQTSRLSPTAGALDPFDAKSVGSLPAPATKARGAQDDPGAPGFETFPGGKSFSVLAPSEVMPSPSTRGSPLGRVKPGDTVTVEAKEGYWMRIRSKNGRVGYVLAQDLTPL